MSPFSRTAQGRNTANFIHVLLIVLTTCWTGCRRPAGQTPREQTAVEDVQEPQRRRSETATEIATTSDLASPATTAGTQHDNAGDPIEKLANQRQEWDERVWADEVAAQRYERFFIHLWDRLRAAQDAWRPLRELTFQSINFRPPTANVEPISLGIQRFVLADDSRTASPSQWAALIDQFQQRGYELVESEWHHSTFRRPTDQPPLSQVSFVLHIQRPVKTKHGTQEGQQRIVARGVLDVRWQGSTAESTTPHPETISVHDWEILFRTGRPLFQQVMRLERQPNQYASAHPIIVYDLNRDGLPEILISRWNRLYWNRGKGKFQEAKLFHHFTPLPECGLVVEVTGDDAVDFVSFNKHGRLIVFPGNDQGVFDQPPFVAAEIEAPDTLAMTAGDIDNDGDLDLWATQYVPSYREGQMPTPYYDANDGLPAYLLVNDGRGRFADQTELAGLAARRRRRTYSTSFVDYDSDGDVDLLVVSDYAGVDLYENDGQGHFRDVTDSQIDQRHLFGMAHTLADFNGDGRLDIYAIGMSSTTARRLDRLGLGREDRPDIHQMRSAMGYGNRMYLRGRERFKAAPFASDVARTGWSWGTTSFDFDLDGDRDIYVANGFRSGDSCQDYCTTFWRHDLYTGTSEPDPTLRRFFQRTLRDVEQGRISWNGFEHNVLLLNQSGQRFTNIGFPAAVAFQYDARAVIGADLDADGRPDLLVAEYPFTEKGFELSLNVYRNTTVTDHHWVGVDLHRHPPGRQVMNAVVTVVTPNGKQVQQVVTGDSFLSQHPAALHFGLGSETNVSEIRIDWPNAAPTVLSDPEIDRWIPCVTSGEERYQ